MRYSAVKCALFLIFASLPPMGAAIIHVPGDQPSIQSGLNAALSGDTVLVAAGTYAENIAWPSVPDIDLISEQGRDVTVISGNNLAQVIHISNVAGVLIQGFTIRDGVPSGSDSGGGIFCQNSGLTLLDSRITENHANMSWGGAGAYFNGGYIHIENNEFIANYADSSAVGSGLAIVGSSATVILNLFSLNTEGSYSGALSVEYAGPEIAHNIFTNNETGGIFLWDAGGLVHHNIIYDNRGSGIWIFSGTSLTIENNLIFDNDDCCVDFYQEYSSAEIKGNTCANNDIGVRMMNRYGILGVDHNIITGHTTGMQNFQSTPLPTLAYNDVWGNTTNYDGISDPTGLNGNISEDPLYASCSFGDFFLSQVASGQMSDSPCVDAGGEQAPGVGFTTRTDLVPDEGIRDMGYHYPVVTPTPTTTPLPIPSTSSDGIFFLLIMLGLALISMKIQP